MNNAPFYIGQKIVRTGEDIPGFVKKGETYIVSALKQCEKCKGWKVSCEGFSPAVPGHKDHCSCGGVIISDNFHYGRAENFAPIDENAYEDVTKVLAVLPQDEVPDVKKIKELVN